MAIDNTRMDLHVQTNAKDPTGAILESRGSSSKATNIPLVFNDQFKVRLFLMEEDSATGAIVNRSLQTGEALSAVVRKADDLTTLASISGLTVSTAQAANEENFNIYSAANTANLSGEYVALSYITSTGVSGWPSEELKKLFWFRTSGASLPPTLKGYESVAVPISDGENPMTELATKINSQTGIGASHVTTGFGSGYVNVEPDNVGALKVDPLVSNTSKLGIERTQLGRDQYLGYEKSMTFNDGAIGTALGSADTITAKFVVKMTQSTGSVVKTLAIQDCTIYRDFSA